jgi:hypothetical protein
MALLPSVARLAPMSVAGIQLPLRAMAQRCVVGAWPYGGRGHVRRLAAGLAASCWRHVGRGRLRGEPGPNGATRNRRSFWSWVPDISLTRNSGMTAGGLPWSDLSPPVAGVALSRLPRVMGRTPQLGDRLSLRSGGRSVDNRPAGHTNREAPVGIQNAAVGRLRPISALRFKGS